MHPFDTIDTAAPVSPSDAGAPIDAWHLPGGARVAMRPVQPQDEAALDEMIRSLSRDARYNRFHAPVNSLSTQMLQAMTRVDPRRQMALVVTAGARVVADARYVVDGSGDGAELAIVVDDRWQRAGIGTRAMQALMAAAGRAGLRRLHGSVLRGNAPMLQLMRRCGFTWTVDVEDRRLVLVQARVAGADVAGTERCARGCAFDRLPAAM